MTFESPRMFREDLVVKLLNVALRSGLRLGEQIVNSHGVVYPDEWEADLPPAQSHPLDMDNPNVIIRREWIES